MPRKEAFKVEDDFYRRGEQPRDEADKSNGGTTDQVYVPRLKPLRDVALTKPEYTVHGLIERDTVGGVFGNKSTLKSFWAIDMGLCVSLGKDFHGRKVRGGLVVYVVGEGGNGIRRRAEAWAQHHNEPIEHNPNFFVTTRSTPFMDSFEVIGLREEITELAEKVDEPVSLVVIDTMARNFGDGDENSTKDAGVFIDNVNNYIRTAFNTSVLVVRHTGHQHQERARGASAIGAALDYEYRATRQGDSLSMQIETEKPPKDGPPHPPISYTAHKQTWEDPKEGRLDSLVLTENKTFRSEESPQTGKLGPNQTKMLKALRELYRRQRKHLQKSGYDPNGAKVSAEDWRRACDDMDSQAFWKAKTKLKDRQLIEDTGVYVYLKKGV
jgi:hypothetical protein